MKYIYDEWWEVIIHLLSNTRLDPTIQLAIVGAFREHPELDSIDLEQFFSALNIYFEVDFYDIAPHRNLVELFKRRGIHLGGEEFISLSPEGLIDPRKTGDVYYSRFAVLYSPFHNND